MKKALEEKLVLGDLGFLQDEVSSPKPTFGEYADAWMRDYARLECKRSTARGYDGILRQYLLPELSSMLLHEIKRSDVKELVADLIVKDLSKSTVRNAVSVVRGVFNHAIDDGLLEANPAAKIGRFIRAAKANEAKGLALSISEVETFLQSALDVSPLHHALFLLAVRVGLRRGELVALQWGDLHFGSSDSDPNRFILVQHNCAPPAHDHEEQETTAGGHVSRTTTVTPSPVRRTGRGGLIERQN